MNSWFNHENNSYLSIRAIKWITGTDNEAESDLNIPEVEIYLLTFITGLILVIMGIIFFAFGKDPNQELIDPLKQITPKKPVVKNKKVDSEEKSSPPPKISSKKKKKQKKKHK